MNARNLLGRATFFSEVLEGSDLDALALVAWRVDYDRGATLMREGEPGDSLLVIASGTVDVTLAGRSETVATLGPGSVVGEMSLLTGARRNADVVAEDEVVALEITKVALEEILARAPDLIDRFGTVLADRQAALDKVQTEVASANKDDLIRQIRRFFGGK